MYMSRTLEACIKKATEGFPALLVTGARQVGKTTFLRHICEKFRNYVTLDDPMVLQLAKSDPALFFQKFPPPILIDEIQYAPELLPYIKMEIDRKKKPGLFWLTGSQQFHLMKGVSESLAGRVGIVQLLGLSRQELIKGDSRVVPFLPTKKIVDARVNAASKLTLKKLYELIWRGAFPAMAINKKLDRDLFYGSYVQTYLQRDVNELAKIGDSMAFLRFLRAVAARTGQMLNIAELSRDVGISANTGKSWISILQASGIIYLLEPFFTNVTKRLVKAPKLYMLDTGLCAYLTEWPSPETLEAGAMSGAMLETWIFVELLKSYLHNGLNAPFYYYRDKDQKEIDLLIVKNGTIYPLEFKKTASPNVHDVRHFQVLKKIKMPVGEGVLICLCEQSLPLGASVQAIPVGAC